MPYKVYWVTGASSGIGRAFALEVASKGAHVILSARRKEALEEVKAAAPDPHKMHVLPLDLSDADSLEAAVDRAEALAGPIDCLVHCGGISQRSLAAETSMEVTRAMIEVNYFGTVELTRLILPRFLERKRGHFAVVSSLMGVFSSPYRSSYCGAKHALHGYFNALRAETAQQGLRVTMICPGFVRTDISKNALIGDGSRQNSMDEKTGAGMSAERCAQIMRRGIEKEKAELHIGGKEVAGIYLSRWLPFLFRRIIQKAKVR